MNRPMFTPDLDTDKRLHPVADAIRAADPETAARLLADLEPDFVGYDMQDLIDAVRPSSRIWHALAFLTLPATRFAAVLPPAMEDALSNGRTPPWPDLAESEREAARAASSKAVAAFLAGLDRDSLRQDMETTLRKAWPDVAGAPLDTPAGPVFRLDAALFTFIRSRIPKVPASREERAALEEVRQLVAELEEKAAARWRTWTATDQQEPLILRPTSCRVLDLLDLWTWHRRRAPAPLWVTCIALASWYLARPRILEARRLSRTPAVPLLFAEDLAAPLVRRGAVFVREDLDGAPARIVLHEEPPDVPMLPASIPERLDLGSLTAQRLIRWMAFEGCRRVAEHAHEPSIVEIPGGLAAFAEKMGCTSHSQEDEILTLLRALARVSVSWDGPEGQGTMPLLTGFELPRRWDSGFSAAAERWTPLRLHLSPLFLPGHVRTLPKGSRVLAPVLPLPPVEVVHERSRGLAARLDWLALVDLARSAEDLLRRGGVRLDWLRLAGAAGLDRRRLDLLLDRWTNDGDTGPARWARADRDRWTLADRPDTRPALALLEDGARRRLDGRNGKEPDRRRGRRKV